MRIGVIAIFYTDHLAWGPLVWITAIGCQLAIGAIVLAMVLSVSIVPAAMGLRRWPFALITPQPVWRNPGSRPKIFMGGSSWTAPPRRASRTMAARVVDVVSAMPSGAP